MKDEDKTKEQLFTELTKMRQRVIELEKDDTERKQADEKLRKSDEKLSIRNQQYETFIENDLFGVWRLNFKKQILTSLSPKKIAAQILETGYVAECNNLLLDMYGYKSKDEFVGKPLKEIVADREAFIKRLIKVTQNNFRAEMVDTKEVDSEGNILYFRNSYFGYVQNGRLHWVWGLQLDITDRKRAEEQIQKDLEEKKVLLKEIHHRVKNNLKIVSSLLSLQVNYIKDKHTRDIFDESRNRVRSIELIHEELYRSKEFSKVGFEGYIEILARHLYNAYYPEPGRIELEIKVEDVSLETDLAVPCGLIINELISNAFKHAFPLSFEGKGKIEIALHPTETGEFELIVKDNGVGIPENLGIHNMESLGIKLVIILAEDQLNGKVRLERRGGTKFTIRFKP